MYKVALNRTWLLCDTQLLCCEMAEQARSYCKQENLWGPAMNKEKHTTKGLVNGNTVLQYKSNWLSEHFIFCIRWIFCRKESSHKFQSWIFADTYFQQQLERVNQSESLICIPTLFSSREKLGNSVGLGRIWLIHPPARIPTCSKPLQDSLDRFKEYWQRPIYSFFMTFDMKLYEQLAQLRQLWS